MSELLALSIGIGLAISLLFSEIFGLAAGGMVVPGYVALALGKPLEVAVTLGAGLLTFAIVHSLSSVIIVYGRRRTVLMILVGYLIGFGLRILAGEAGHYGWAFPALDFKIIGYIIPGLIAIWIDRQGFVETFSALLTASAVVRLILILCVGAELGP